MLDELKIIVKLKVELTEVGVTAFLSFSNDSAAVFFLDKISSCLSGEIKRNVFKIMDDEIEFRKNKTTNCFI